MTVAPVQLRAPGFTVTRERVLGVLFIVVAVTIVVLFGMDASPTAKTTFGLNPVGGDVKAVHVGDVVLPSRATAFVVAAICAFLGATQLTRGFGTRVTVVLGIVVVLFTIAFLTWAARDNSLNLVGLLQSTLLRAVPITFGALAGVLCERSGVVNIGIEGMLLSAAFTGSIVASAVHNLWIGMLGGAIIGGVLGWVLAVLAIRYLVNQIIAGTFINLFALGMTGFLSARVLERYQDLNNPGLFQPIAIPVLSKIPVLGPILFDVNVFVYIMFALIVIIHVGLFYTRWGLRVRAVGEHPRAADTVGIRVLFTRYRNVILGGMVAGIGGAYFTLGSVGGFNEDMTAGRGFIGLAAMIFGRWNPVGAFLAALVFGFSDSLQIKLSILHVPIPGEFLQMAPYLVTIFVVAGAVRKSRAPAADGQPYVKE
jgi:general nucleoside transport system permease protein